MFRTAVLFGIYFGVYWFDVTNIWINSSVSPSNLYFIMSGTTVLQPIVQWPAAETEIGQILGTIDTTSFMFEIFMDIGDGDFINLAEAYIVYELLRICFDRTVPLKDSRS